MNDLIARLLFVFFCLLGFATFFVDAGVLGLPVFAVAIALWSPRIGKSAWWGLLGLVPLVNFAMAFLMALTPTVREKEALAADKK